MNEKNLNFLNFEYQNLVVPKKVNLSNPSILNLFLSNSTMMNSFSIACRLIILLFLKNPYQALKSAWILRDGTQLTVRQLLTKDLSAKWFGPKMMELLISQTTNILKTFWLLQQRAQSARSSKKIKLHSQQRGLLHFSESLNLHITTLCKNAIKRVDNFQK